MMRRLGEWTRAERLGGGGYAQVFRARHGNRPDEAALKVFDDPSYVNTYEREVASLMAMDGAAGTPRLLDHGRDGDGNLCIAMTLAPGRRLDRLIAGGTRLASDSLAALVRQMLAVLAVAHGRGLLHKDIKTSNLLADGERFTLIDWGVAEPVGDGSAESIRAKQDIVAPECYYGRHGVPTDFYALGWLVVHAATGELPYGFAANRERDYRVAAHCLERPELPAGLPAEWRALVGHWIAKAPAERLIGYDLDELLARAAAIPPAASPGLMDRRNMGRSSAYLRQAAEAGVPYAQYELALRALKDGGREEAMHWLERAAGLGYGRAAGRLAAVLLDGGDAAELPRARELLLTAGTRGNTDACYRLGMLLREAGEAEAAAGWLRRAADAGHRSAQYRYARLMDLKTESGRALAAKYFDAAAERGHPRARRRIEELSAVAAGGPS
ncbi:MAG: Sel1-like repeat-containing protein kinase family protein [Sterolibacteriaceae bacterium MAG5]|nr:Sel1-like repeat-containing protein kinase family protein [Candidatus Nitricoxidireducens bremensis]